MREVMVDILIPTNKKTVDGLIKEIEENTTIPYRIIASCQPASAAINRNLCLNYANSDEQIFMDDDITGLFPGWAKELLKGLEYDNTYLVSSRLLNENGAPQSAMGMNSDPTVDHSLVYPQIQRQGVKYKRVTPACIAFRRTHIRFDENYRGSGLEDTDWLNRLCEYYTEMDFRVSNNCKLIHKNEMKNQSETWKHNHYLYMQKFPWDNFIQRLQGPK